MTAQREPQSSFDEEHLDSEALEALLEDREEAKAAYIPVRKRYSKLNADAKEMVENLELKDGTYRIGAFVVTQKPVAEREIEFKRTERKSITFKPAKTKA